MRREYRNITSTILTQFEGVFVGYHPRRLTSFSVEEVALGFINALKLESLEDASEQIYTYAFDDNEYEDGVIRIRCRTVPYAPLGQDTRANIMYILGTLPIILMRDNFIAGVSFYETYDRRMLYSGVLNRNNHPPRLTMANQTTDNSSSSAVASQKRSPNNQLLGFQQTDNTTMKFTVPGTNENLELKMYFVGRRISKVHMFEALINSMLFWGLEDSSEEVEATAMTEAQMPAWIFMRRNPASPQLFQIFQLLAIVEAMARYCTQQGIYSELVYDFFFDGSLVSGGCVTAPQYSREWCKGLRGGAGIGIWTGDIVPYLPDEA